jgi:hypothetical protein
VTGDLQGTHELVCKEARTVHMGGNPLESRDRAASNVDDGIQAHIPLRLQLDIRCVLSEVQLSPDPPPASSWVSVA